MLPGQDRPHAPGRSLGKHCRPVALPVKIGCRPVVLPMCCAAGRLPTCCPWCCRPVLPTCCAAGQLPAGCPTLPARHSGSVAGPVVLPGQDRPHAPGPVVLPTCCAAGRLPTCCPWCCRPVLPTCCAAGQLPAGCPTLPAPWCCRRAALPAGCRRAARGAAGPCCRRAALPINSRPVAPRSRPVTREALPARGAAGQDRPHAPGRLPTCCRSRSVADMLPVVLPCPSTLLYAARLRCAGIAPYDRHMPRCPTFLTPSTGISPSDSVTPIYFTLEEV